MLTSRVVRGRGLSYPTDTRDDVTRDDATLSRATRRDGPDGQFCLIKHRRLSDSGSCQPRSNHVASAIPFIFVLNVLFPNARIFDCVGNADLSQILAPEDPTDVARINYRNHLDHDSQSISVETKEVFLTCFRMRENTKQ